MSARNVPFCGGVKMEQALLPDECAVVRRFLRCLVYAARDGRHVDVASAMAGWRGSQRPPTRQVPVDMSSACGQVLACITDHGVTTIRDVKAMLVGQLRQTQVEDAIASLCKRGWLDRIGKGVYRVREVDRVG